MLLISGSRFLLFCSILFLVQNASAEINTRIKASRLSGVAPLAVFFDATATTSTATSKPFHELHYAWKFDDRSAGEWQHGNSNSNDKNLAYGPVAAHVFKTPGVYTVNLAAKGSNDSNNITSVTITVQNPDSVFTGSNTVCFSASGTFTDCPTGALRVTTSSMNTVQRYIRSNRRLLLRRGDTFIGSSAMTFEGVERVMVIPFGSGARPFIRQTNGSVFTFDAAKDIRVYGLELEGFGAGSVAFNGGQHSENLLIMDNTLVPNTFASGLKLSGSVLNANNEDIHDGIFIVGNIFNDLGFGRGGYGVFMAAGRFAIQGNYINDILDGEHIIRIVHGEVGVISNNYLARQALNKSILSVRSQDANKACSAGCGRYTHDILVSDNIILNASSGAVSFVDKQTGSATAIGRDLIFERNYVARALDVPLNGGRVQAAFKRYETTENLTVRNNIVNLDGFTGYQSLDIRGGTGTVAYNNTCYTANNDERIKCVDADSSNLAYNNLLYAPNASHSEAVRGFAHSSNMLASTNPFGSSHFHGPDDFVLASGSVAINGGVPVPIFDDYKNTPRRGAAYEIGAYEFGVGSIGGAIILLLFDD